MDVGSSAGHAARSAALTAPAPVSTQEKDCALAHAQQPTAVAGEEPSPSGFNPAALEFVPGLPLAVVERSWCDAAYEWVPTERTTPIAPAANGCLGTGGCVSGREGPVN